MRRIFGALQFVAGVFLIACYFFWPEFAPTALFLDSLVGIKQLYLLFLAVFMLVALLVVPIVLCLTLDCLADILKIKIRVLFAYMGFLKRLFEIVNRFVPDLKRFFQYLSRSQNKFISLMRSFRNMFYGLGLAIILNLVKGSDDIVYLWIAGYLAINGVARVLGK